MSKPASAAAVVLPFPASTQSADRLARARYERLAEIAGSLQAKSPVHQHIADAIANWAKSRAREVQS